jgi:hypothetical protein
MAMPLAIEHPAVSRRTPQATAAARIGAARDVMADRPPIPRGVISWSDPELPVGAGDPAAGIDGPPPFHVLRDEFRRSPAAPRLEGVLFAIVLAAFLGAVSLAVVDVARSDALASLAGAHDPAILGRVPVVETRILSLQPVFDTALRAPAANAAGHGG